MIRPLLIFFIATFVIITAAVAAPSASQPAKGGFLFTTFKGEATPQTEQIYFGISQDGLHWDSLNNANPVLVSDIGEKGVRDPYLLRSHDGKKFFLIATDLDINLNRDWHRATHAGSKSIVIWESDDLVKWSAPRLVKVAPDDAGCTWAPEAIYDEETKDYLVYWASTTERDNFAKQRIWSARTTDFKTFSKPEIFIEKPKNIIDTDIVRNVGEGGEGGDSKYYRFTKDDRNKDITMEVADKLAGPWSDVPGFTLPIPTNAIHSYEGPAAFQLSPTVESKSSAWCLLLDNPGRGYKPFTTTSLASGKFAASDEVKFPFAFRHGSILPLSAEEYQRLKSAYEVELKK